MALVPVAVFSLAGCQTRPIVQRQPLAVSVQPAGRHDFPVLIDTISTLEAPEAVSLAAQAGGRILSLRIRQGDTVRRGQLLVVLDQTQLREEVKALQGQRDESWLNYQRFDYLARVGAASVIQRDSLRQNFVAAEAKLKARQADLAYRDLRAPIDGVVSDVVVTTGDVIQAGTPFTTIQRSSRLLARVEVPSRYGNRVQRGQTVLVFPSGGQAGITGDVISIDPRVNGATQTFLVKARLAATDAAFRNGERVRTQLLIDKRAHLAVPALAVTRISGQAFVFVLGSFADLERFPGNAPLASLRQLPSATRFALQRPVTLGPLQDNRYPVLQGLEPGQQLITSHLVSLRHGTPVTLR